MHTRLLTTLLLVIQATALSYGQAASGDSSLTGTLPAAAAATAGTVGADLASSFGLGIDLGYESLPDTSGTTMIGWNTLGLSPDLQAGDFGLGLDVTLRYRFDGGADNASFEVRPEDWIPDATHSFMDLYLPLIRYVRYGAKGAPFYVNLGEIASATLGNGFLVDGYRNTLFKTTQPIRGLTLDVDGDLFGFPYIGLESLIANFAAFDLLGARFYVRPGAKSGIPLLEGMQIGLSAVADTNPWYFDTDPTDGHDKYNPPSTAVVSMFDLDFRQPIVSSDLFSLTFLGDLALQNLHMGSQFGLGGSLLGFMNYKGMIRILDSSFIPAYFDATYDLMREDKYSAYSQVAASSATSAGWLANLGFTAGSGAFVFDVMMTGPFEPDPAVMFMNPDLKATLTLKEGVLGGLGIEAFYSKKNITSLADLIDPAWACVGAQVSYKLGPAVILLTYDLRYDPYADGDPWVVSSRLSTSIGLF